MTSVEFHQTAWELMANLWKHAGNVLLIFLLTLGADPACHHKYLAVEKTRDFVQLCLESDSKLILETLPGTLHIFGKQKIFRGSPVFIMHEIVMGGEKGVCVLHKRRGELELLLELNRLFLALALCTFPQEHGFLCEKRLFLNYLLFIYYSVSCASYNGRSVTCGVSKWSWWELRAGSTPRAHHSAGKHCCGGIELMDS